MARAGAYEKAEEARPSAEAVCVRPFRPKDASTFWILDRTGHLLTDATDEVAASQTAAGAAPACSEDQLWVAEVQGRVIGTVGIACDERDVAELRHLRVEPGWRDCGVAGRLVGTAAREARELGYLKLVLEIEIVAERATRVLGNLGFQYVGDRTTDGKRVMQFYLDLYRKRQPRSRGAKVD